MSKESLLTIVSGGSYMQREAAIAACITQSVPSETNAVILEGLPGGSAILAPDTSLQIHRIAPGCICCIGNLVLRVTLNRILKKPPARLYLGIANAAHLDQIMNFLLQAPYGDLLKFDQDLRI